MSVSSFYQKQLIWGLMGFAGMITFMLFDYRHLRTIAWPLFWVTVILLACVPVIGKTIYGARRWLDLGFFNFQPSEMAKITILVIGAKILSRSSDPLNIKNLAYVVGVGLDSCRDGNCPAGPRFGTQYPAHSRRYDPLSGADSKTLQNPRRSRAMLDSVGLAFHARLPEAAGLSRL